MTYFDNPFKQVRSAMTLSPPALAPLSPLMRAHPSSPFTARPVTQVIELANSRGIATIDLFAKVIGMHPNQVRGRFCALRAVGKEHGSGTVLAAVLAHEAHPSFDFLIVPTPPPFSQTPPIAGQVANALLAEVVWKNFTVRRVSSQAWNDVS